MNIFVKSIEHNGVVVYKICINPQKSAGKAGSVCHGTDKLEGQTDWINGCKGHRKNYTHFAAGTSAKPGRASGFIPVNG